MTDRVSTLEQRIAWTRGFRCGTDKAVLQAMARWFAWRPDGTNIRFTVAALAAKSGVPKRSVDRALERLKGDWWIEVTQRRHRAPPTYRIVLERLATADPDALTLRATVAFNGAACAPEWRSNEGLARHSGAQETSGAQENGPDFDEVAHRSTAGAGVRTDPPPPSDLERHSGAQPRDVAAFLAWAHVTYPDYAQGAQLVVDPGRDGALVQGLLARYARTRLEAMAIACWTIAADGDPTSHASWIAKSDRSLRVLRHKAAFLDRVVVGAQQLTLGPMATFTPQELDAAKRALTFEYGRCPHDPPHDEWRDCVREIALERRVG